MRNGSVSLLRFDHMRRAIGPIVAAMLGGCVYIPTWERVVGPDGAKDFRPVVTGRASDRPIVVGSTRKSAIVAVLGTPPIRSVDGTAVAYTLRTDRSFWVGWLGVEPVEQRLYVLVLSFDQNGILARHEQLLDDVKISPVPVPQVLETNLVSLLAKYNSSVEPSQRLHEPGKEAVVLPVPLRGPKTGFSVAVQ